MKRRLHRLFRLGMVALAGVILKALERRRARARRVIIGKQQSIGFLAEYLYTFNRPKIYLQ
jgi:hypothetical protein